MTVVWKVGGSLLNLKGVGEKIQLALQKRPGEQHLIISGGGAAADVVRGWSETHQIDDNIAHWLALESIGFNCRLLEQLLGFKSASLRETAQAIWDSQQQPVLLELLDFVANEEDLGASAVPHDWTVTSDSLAAWVAWRWPAKELILLKSIPTPLGITAEQASCLGYVDRFFPKIAKRIPRIHWCHVRASEIVIETWLTHVVDFSEDSVFES